MSKDFIKLSDVLIPQPKSKIKAGKGKNTGKYKFFTSSNSQNKFVDEYQYDEPALIFGTGGSASIHFCDEKFATSTDCLVFFAEEEQLLKSIYLYLSGNMWILENGFKGAGLKHISKQYILNISFSLPEINEQCRIAAVLDKISNLITKRRQQLDKLDEMVKARFVEMFGDPIENNRRWPTKTLDSVCKSIVDCPHSTPSYTSVNTGYMCIRTSIVKKNCILWNKIEYIPEQEYYQRIQRKKPEKGDIVYTREGAILGIAAMINRDCNVALGQRSMLLSPDPTKCLPQFLSSAMNFDSFLRKALRGVSGSASPHINVGDIKVFSIIIPPLSLQQQFSDFVVQTEKTKANISRSLEKLETLKKALMQEYFG
ncbi:MAG: restriction endonuclease subunit S [Ruthenibacterium sp.]